VALYKLVDYKLTAKLNVFQYQLPYETTQIFNRKFNYEGSTYYIALFLPADYLKKMIFTIPLLPINQALGSEKIHRALSQRKSYEFTKGFMVFSAETYEPIKDFAISSQVYNQYCLWENIFISPFYFPRNLPLDKRLLALRKLIGNQLDLQTPKQPKNASEQEIANCLKELDADLRQSNKFFEEKLSELEPIIKIFIDLSDSPTKEGFDKLKSETIAYIKTLDALIHWTSIRKQNWKKLESALETNKAFKEIQKKGYRKIIDAVISDIVGFFIPIKETATQVSLLIIKKVLDYIAGFNAIESFEKDLIFRRKLASDFLQLYDSFPNKSLFRDITKNRI